MYITETLEEQNNINYSAVDRIEAPSIRGFKYHYKGYHNYDSYCYLTIRGAVVLASEPPIGEDCGTSITNMAEHLATRVCHRYSIDPKFLIWIEHYPRKNEGEVDGFNRRGNRDLGIYEPTWNLVQFNLIETDKGTRFINPRQTRITKEASDALMNREESK